MLSRDTRKAFYAVPGASIMAAPAFHLRRSSDVTGLGLVGSASPNPLPRRLQHITRVARVLRQPFGNALLVGVGGSGRQSLTRIAAFMAEFDVFTIEISKSYTKVEWYEDLRRVLKLAGADGKTTVFLFSDTQLKEESFLEDLNNILNTGERAIGSRGGGALPGTIARLLRSLGFCYVRPPHADPCASACLVQQILPSTTTRQTLQSLRCPP